MFWKILKKLGGGGAGEVFLASTPAQEEVALKVLSQPSANAADALVRESQFLMRLRHPALVPLLGFSRESGDVFGEEKGPCYWMGIVEGRPLLEAAEGSDPKTILGWLTQALEALDYLHSQGVVHADLSPQNLVIDQDGRLRIMDFGSALRSGTTQSSMATLPYAAPERVDGRPLPASDLFSLGTVFYEALSSRHPRAGARSLGEITRLAPLPLQGSAPALADAFRIESRVIDRMIAVDLSQRFSSAREVLEALQGREIGAATGPRPEYHSAVMIGANRHFERVQRAIDTLKKSSHVFCLHGATGVGKDRFLRETAFLSSWAGLSVRDVPPGEFSKNIRSLLHDQDHAGGVTLFHDLQAVPLSELSRLLTLRRTGLTPRGALVVFEWNDDGLDETKRFFFSELLHWADVTEIFLKNLKRDQSSEFLKGALGESPTDEVLDAVFKTTTGNPLLLVKLAGVLRRDPNMDPQEILKIQGLDTILQMRLKELGEKEWKILRAVAFAGAPVSVTKIGEISGLAANESASILEGLTLRNYLQPHATATCSIALKGLEDLIIRQTPEAEARDLHERWFKALREEPYPNPQRLRHAAALGKDKDVWMGLLPTAEVLVSQGQKGEALSLIDAMKGLLKEPATRSRALRLEINLLNDLGRYEEALSVAEEWVLLGAPDEPSDFRAVKYWLITAINHQNLGRHDEATRRLQRCLDQGLKLGTPECRPFLARAYSLLGAEALRQGDAPGAMTTLQSGLNFTEAKDRRRGEILRHLAVTLSQQGDAVGAEHLLQAARALYKETGFVDGEFAVLLQEGILAVRGDDPKKAEAAYHEAETIADRHENPDLIASVWHNRGILARKRGDLATALNLLTKAQEIFRLLANQKDLGDNLRETAITEASVGHFEKALAIAESDPAAQEALGRIEELKDGTPAPVEDTVPPDEALDKHWNRELALRCLTRGFARPDRITHHLRDIYKQLPAALQVSFVERHDWKKWSVPMTANNPLGPTTSPSPQLLFRLLDLTQSLLREQNMRRVLERLMDAALDMTGAQNGFLLLKDDKEKSGPFPGFSIAAAHDVVQEDLEGLAYTVSLSAVREALKTGEPVVTDNALQDARFRDAKSVHLHQLKSILALPIVSTRGAQGIQGVFYLDHPLEQGQFSEDIITPLRIFASIAGLALQKGQMIEGLKEANAQLTKKVEVQASEAENFKREIQETRLLLKHRYSDIIGKSPRMIEVLSLVDRITDSTVPVWIYGESGTGKEAIARALHFNGGRQSKPFVTENCSALPEALLESELFGHKKGAFTHAVADKKGILQYADGGTIFLDEIADMSANLQAKLLRFLQEGEIRPVGSHQVTKVDVRVISASNRNLAELVRQGKFREDLYYRLNGVTVSLPPLRERIDDLPLLAEHFLKLAAEKEKKTPLTLDPSALELLLKYTWPGNVRELQNTLGTAALFAENGVIFPKSFKFKADLTQKAAPERPVTLIKGAEDAEPELLKLLNAIRDQCFHKGNAAKALGISRRNLYTRLARFGVASDVKTIRAAIDKYLA